LREVEAQSNGRLEEAGQFLTLLTNIFKNNFARKKGEKNAQTVHKCKKINFFFLIRQKF